MDKTDLENAVFFRAAQRGEDVYGVQGKWVYAGADACLRQLVRIYNQLFEEENYRFWAESEGTAQGEWWHFFKLQQAYPPYPLYRAYRVPFFAKDEVLELFLARH